ncbi:hypothetical protein GCK72_016885 [Caenorhabditis remanei]|uniref:Domain of unknown function WSN domain-containing protein n=1 Tax=Caenorhabditis remanei TaxID=31234 RepID=A0A6A5G639_CAERE|nr:hypothetical protein GCK72_016885 [Caenorhabditis remanei]KAF1750336.1 hypothetical protein GCK72_016885 [Caenorhabditis remanei]
MKLVVIALLLAISISSAYTPRHIGNRPRYQRATNYDSPYKQAGLDELSFAKGVSQNEDFNSIIQKLSATARVVSALSLQKGLSDGSIPVDDVIAELLNIESADLKGLEAFDKKKVDDFVNNIYGVKLDENSKILDEGFRDVFMIRKIWTEIGGAKGLDGLPDDATYKELESLKKLDPTPLVSLPLDRLITQISSFSTLNDAAIETLKSELSSILNSIDKLAESSDLKKYIAILDRLKPIGSFAQMADLYRNLNSFMVVYKKVEIDSALLNFKNLKVIFSSFESDSSTKTMSSIITSRLFHHSLTRLHSAGFVNKFMDLRYLKDDVKDQWLLNQIDPSIDIKGLGHLDQLEGPIKELDEKWMKISTQNAYNTVRRLAGAHALLNSETSAELTRSHLETEMEMIEKRRTYRRVAEVSMKQNLILERAGTLNKKLATLSLIGSMAIQIKEPISCLSKNSSFDDVRRILQFMQGLKFQLSIVTSAPAFKDVDLETSQPVYIIDIKTNPSTKPCIGEFKQMQELGSDFDEVAQAAMAVIEVRELIKAGDVTKTMKEVTLALSDSSASLASIRKILDTWKADGTGGDKNLARNLKDLPQLSKSFGEGVNALVMAKRTMDKETEFRTFVESGQSVRTVLTRNTALIPEIKLKFAKRWGDFDGTVSEIISIITLVNGWIGQTNVAQNSILSDYSPIFSKIPKFNDVDLDIDNFMAAVGIFDKISVNPKWNEDALLFKKSLLELSKLDLKFSRFQSSLNQMPTTLLKLSEKLRNPNTTDETNTEELMVDKDHEKRRKLENLLKEDRMENGPNYGSNDFEMGKLAMCFIIQLLF